MSKCRLYCITRNIIDGEDIDAVISAFKTNFEAWVHCRYMCFQHEKGTCDHLQVYLELKTPQRYAAIKKIAKCNHIHIKPKIPESTRQQARYYCMDRTKDSYVAGPWEVGSWNKKGSGNRSDIDTLVEACKRHQSVLAVARELPHLVIRYARGAAVICKAFRGFRHIPPRVVLLYGKTGCGKTRFPVDMFGYRGLHRKSPDDRWYDGYECQDALLFDDFAGAASKVSLTRTLQMFDRYPFAVEVKGDVIEMLATKIFVTTNLHPSSWFDFGRREEQYRALARRFHHIILFKGKLPYIACWKSFFFYHQPMADKDIWQTPCEHEMLDQLFDVPTDDIIARHDVYLNKDDT